MPAEKFLYAYAYEQYRDDANVVAFFRVYTQIGQSYLDALNALDLPIYSGPNLTGELLDWVLVGLYGIDRPALPMSGAYAIGSYGTYTYGSLSYGARHIVNPSTFYQTTDDIYKRLATWALYKGDGRVFDIRWLKRRIIRFLTGVDGTDGVTDQTYQVSVTVVGSLVTIRIYEGLRSVTGGAIYGRFSYGTKYYGQLDSNYVKYSSLDLAGILKSAIDSGVLELPFQFTYDVVVG